MIYSYKVCVWEAIDWLLIFHLSITTVDEVSDVISSVVRVSKLSPCACVGYCPLCFSTAAHIMGNMSLVDCAKPLYTRLVHGQMSSKHNLTGYSLVA